MTDKLVDYVERVACYIRVSTQEQKLHGISLDSQRDKLKEYAKNHGLKIVEWYEDEGISGRKLIKKRPALQRMLNDAKAKKFDRILFIKLDRFFRSVAEYHECMKYIDPVIWTATEEKYDLSTANGRAFVNMKLTIAELEADQTSERIRLVNDYKAKSGQALTGARNQGLGFTVQKDINGVKRVVKDPETEHIILPIINHYLKYQNKTATCKWLSKTYGINKRLSSLTNMLSDTKLYGRYRDNPNYCEPYIDKKTFDKIQVVLSKNIKQAPSDHVYLFTGLAKCPECGCNMTYVITTNSNSKSKTRSLRCNKASIYKTCSYRHTKSENIIEKTLLNNLDTYINNYITEVEITDNRVDTDNETINKRITSVKSEMTKVKRMYRKEDITEEEYDNDMAELKSELKELETQLEPVKERDLTIYKELLKGDWRNLYNALTRENKRSFWRKYIKEIIFDKKGSIIGVIFF